MYYTFKSVKFFVVKWKPMVISKIEEISCKSVLPEDAILLINDIHFIPFTSAQEWCENILLISYNNSNFGFELLIEMFICAP